MTVYVDQLMDCVPNRRWRWRQACHLVADELDDLHDFAYRLGLKRAWFQMSRSGVPHYDLTATMRARAVRLGAEEIGPDRFCEIAERWRTRSAMERKTGSLFTP